ncbi:hypothetical protein VE03_06019 [Pseudogymnoascus sp. 23342-1-I1]|nr:hypothetical protein VE03_06019 [Pseudogymnoascus sp. 23342-1-I1]
MNSIGGIGLRLEKEIWPSFNKLICSTGKSPGADDWPLAEKEIVKPLWAKLQRQGLKLPRFDGQIEKLAGSIVRGCVKKQKVNFCKKADLEKMKGCMVDKAMGFIMGNLDLADKYGDEANCKIAEKILNDKAIWDWGRAIVVKFAKKVT